jgi:aspartate aminotransferase-like enzyme
MGAFGPLAGRMWRIGTMAGNARPGPISLTLDALADTLGTPARRALDAALDAATRRFDAVAPAASI